MLLDRVVGFAAAATVLLGVWLHVDAWVTTGSVDVMTLPHAVCFFLVCAVLAYFQFYVAPRDGIPNDHEGGIELVPITTKLPVMPRLVGILALIYALSLCTLTAALAIAPSRIFEAVSDLPTAAHMLRLFSVDAFVVSFLAASSSACFILASYALSVRPESPTEALPRTGPRAAESD